MHKPKRDPEIVTLVVAEKPPDDTITLVVRDKTDRPGARIALPRPPGSGASYLLGVVTGMVLAIYLLGGGGN